MANHFFFFVFVILMCVPSGRASMRGLAWDANAESDLAGYRIFSATFSLLNVSTTTATSNFNVQKSSVGKVVEYDLWLAAGKKRYVRLVAFDVDGNQSGFNVDASSSPAQLEIFIKPGDANNDNKVNINDLSILLTDWLTNSPRADFNNSGRTDLTDLSILLTNWGS